MLKRLRWQLTLLYMLAALGLLLLVGAGSYTLLRYYFIYETDQALDYKMAQLFEAYSLPDRPGSAMIHKRLRFLQRFSFPRN
jgi:hypothetical protein